MTFDLWYLLIGGLLIFAVIARSMAERVFVNTTMLYLAAGFAIGSGGLRWVAFDPVTHAWAFERLAEIAVIISLFSAGLKLSLPLTDPRWWIPVRLAFGSMVLTIAAIAAVGVVALKLPLGAAILLGAIIAPTDPVLAGDVQLTDPDDRDHVRGALTGEAAMNDGAAFPFVLLGLGLLGLHELGELGWRWLAADVLWAIAGGLAIGWSLGFLVGRLVLYLRAQHREAVGFDEFLALGLIGLSYGLALVLDAYGFLAVFAAGLALRRIERRSTNEGEALQIVDDGSGQGEAATHPATAPVIMTRAVLSFNQQTEHVGEVIVVLFVGTMLSAAYVTQPALLFTLLLLVAIRPACAWLGLIASPTSTTQRALIAWFGIRGLGSIYYLSYAVNQGLPVALGRELAPFVLTVVAVSVIMHGFSVSPLMRHYERERG